MRPVWRCKCDYEEDDTPDIIRPLSAHKLNAGRVDGPGVHGVVGLFDADSGDLLLEGGSRKEALKKGLISSEVKEGGDSKPKPPPSKSSSSSKKGGSYIRGQVLYRNIPLPSSIEGYFAIYRTTFIDGWTNDDDGIAQWILDVIENFTREHIVDIFKLDNEDRGAIVRAEKIIDKIKRMSDPDNEEPEPDREDVPARLDVLFERMEEMERRWASIG